MIDKYCYDIHHNLAIDYVNYVSKLDSIRTTDWKTVFPELFQILNVYY
jgi:hypothetical protein